MGYLTLGAASSFLGIAIPPGADQFIIDAYCPSSGTEVRTMSVCKCSIELNFRYSDCQHPVSL
jgi:hypothetical protein